MANFIKKIELKNIKRFKSLVIEDLTQFNLFSGIGKTTLCDCLKDFKFNTKKDVNLFFTETLEEDKATKASIKFELVNILDFVNTKVEYEFDKVYGYSQEYGNLNALNLLGLLVTGKRDGEVVYQKKTILPNRSIQRKPRIPLEVECLSNLVIQHDIDLLLECLNVILPTLKNISIANTEAIFDIVDGMTLDWKYLEYFDDTFRYCFNMFLKVIMFKDSVCAIDDVGGVIACEYKRSEFIRCLVKLAVKYNTQLILTSSRKDVLEYWQDTIKHTVRYL